MDEEEHKLLQKWMKIAERLNASKTLHNFKEGEVWWAAVGKNIGIEINGKGDGFARPVLIYKKLSRQGFMGIPLISQKHGGDWYMRIWLGKKDNRLVLSQAKVMSALRLYRKMGRISKKELERAEDKLGALYSRHKKYPQTLRNGVIQDIPEYATIVAQMRRVVKRLSGWILRKMARRKPI